MVEGITDMNSGVLQGNVMGSLLYTNDLPELVQSNIESKGQYDPSMIQSTRGLLKSGKRIGT